MACGATMTSMRKAKMRGFIHDDTPGGSAFFPASVNEVSDITRSLAHDIRNQYTITYRPEGQKANQSYHPIVVEAQCAGCGKMTVHTRNGYYTCESVH